MIAVCDKQWYDCGHHKLYYTLYDNNECDNSGCDNSGCDNNQLTLLDEETACEAIILIP